MNCPGSYGISLLNWILGCNSYLKWWESEGLELESIPAHREVRPTMSFLFLTRLLLLSKDTIQEIPRSTLRQSFVTRQAGFVSSTASCSGARVSSKSSRAFLKALMNWKGCVEREDCLCDRCWSWSDGQGTTSGATQDTRVSRGFTRRGSTKLKPTGSWCDRQRKEVDKQVTLLGGLLC